MVTILGTCTRRLALINALLVGLTVTTVAASGVVVNEVLVNEPGGRVSLEWFELYNSSQDSLSLLDDTLSIDSQFSGVFGVVTVPPFGYVVVSRNIIAFEERFGDSSGIWGDDSLLENYTIAQLSFSLKNTVGALSVFKDTLVARLSWPAAGADGVSWERVTEGVDSVMPSTDVLGATPGRRNSITPLMRDWEIVSLKVQPDRGMPTHIDVTLRNIGVLTLPAGCLLVLRNPQLSSAAPFGVSGDSLLCEPLPSLNPLESVTISVSMSVAGVYDTIGLTVAGFDDRSSNNIRILPIPGVDFPPLLINEFLPNPQAALGSEWVEVRNISLKPVNISGWLLGDELGYGEIDTAGVATVVIQPGDYLVLAQNPSAFSLFYGFSVLSNPVIGWRTLNNARDIVRLQDPFGFLADSVAYSAVFGENVSWSRSEEENTRGLWGRSALSGGTPGDSNQTLLNPDATNLAVTISPNPFSPDGDGFDETTEIEISSPDGGDMLVTVYDSRGSEIRRLFSGAPFSGNLNWDGRTDSGRRVPIGIYIVYVKVENSGSVKKTVVVAR